MSRSGRRPRVAGRGRSRPARTGSGPEHGPGGVTVQLLPHLLAAGALPLAAVGDELDVAPAIYAARVEAGRGLDRWSDRWRQDEFGTVEAAGSVLAARLDPVACSCWVDVLDVAGRLVPLNPAAALLDEVAEGDEETHGPVVEALLAPGTDGESGRVRVEGALYLDPELGPGTPYGSAVSLCRRRYRVEGLRRYRRTAGMPVDPTPMAALPPPAVVSDDVLYVAELSARA